MNILITGKDSNIGNNIQRWFEGHQQECEFHIDQLDVITDVWRSYDYSRYDAIIHVAAIVHRPELRDWNLYKRVNADLPFEIAKLAKKQGVKQFVFISSMAVYGYDKTLRNKPITESTIPNPEDDDLYGKSKFMAEQFLHTIVSDDFRLSIVRPPNVYGPSGRGGYVRKFTKYLHYLPIIPDAYSNVAQSMLYLDNLSELIRLIVVERKQGTFMPQDSNAVSTVELLSEIARAKHWRKPTSKLFGLFVYIFSFVPIVKKIYGGVAYCSELSEIEGMHYRIVEFSEGMKKTIETL